MKLIVVMYSIGLLNWWLWMIFLWFVEYIEGIIWIKAFYKYVMIFHDDGSEKRDLDNG